MNSRALNPPRMGALRLDTIEQRVFVTCDELSEDGPTVVHLEAPLLFDVPESDDLFEFIALHADDYVFGHLSARRTKDGILVMFTHTLLGDYLDAEELIQAAVAVVGVGNELDDDLQRTYGGTRFHEESE